MDSQYAAFARLVDAIPPVEQTDTSATFALSGYSVDLFLRDAERLVVTFDSRSSHYPPSRTRKAWGKDFIERLRVSALHVKPDQSCWYRRAELATFFQTARACGLFTAFPDVITYGGSMGGFGALSFSGLTHARACLALNPQVNLGPAVRSWEDRWSEALDLDWDDALCDITRQTAEVRDLIVVVDPYFMPDRMQVDLIGTPGMTRLHLPFVAHRIPGHLQSLGMLKTLFKQVLAGAPDGGWFYRQGRKRRKLRRYREELLARTLERPDRHARLLDLLPPEDETIG